mgnify:CR=1 FL=1
MDVGVIIAGVVSFVSVILALVVILSFAKSKLVMQIPPTGLVSTLTSRYAI